MAWPCPRRCWNPAWVPVPRPARANEGQLNGDLSEEKRSAQKVQWELERNPDLEGEDCGPPLS